ncbi:putative ATPase [Stackebrandtia albiflava]|uniref:Putative ATPase n=1 Tax=Stackebrandtia albiflava TaxID=406432 RepID=A0A562URA1_9ACTN|nr:BTAD domain-containing putative transcriptional regulator [Stackebrandtia albiflava]TWJ08155.1 putative ATPase [Stackebrandtia albiflava]
MRFAILGPLEVRTDAGEAVVIPEARVRALLCVLLAHNGQVVPADRLMHHLWGDRPPARGRAVLRSKVSLLRRALEDAEPGGHDLVTWRSTGYLVEAGTDRLDTARFEDLVRRAEGADPVARDGLLSEAVSSWRGEPLPELADREFAVPIVARLTEQYLSAVEARAEARLESGEHRGLVAQLRELAARYPWRNRLNGVLMLSLYQSGRHAEALRFYAAVRRRSREELGVEPDAALSRLHLAMLRRDPTLEAPRPRPVGNLPPETSPLVGRETELADLAARTSRHRLVTVTGPGGVGKTSLAVATARSLRHDYSGGVWLADLTPVPAGTSRVDLIAETVAAELGLTGDTAAASPGSSAFEALAAYLLTHRTLLVLDNCEHVVAAAAALAERLSRAAPDSRVLATGREPLAVPAESVLSLGPLPDSDAARLFATRAAAAGYRVTDGDAGEVAAICRRLDGIPLALELAAGRVAAWGPSGLRERLERHWEPPAVVRRGVPERHRTIRSTVDWSRELLTGPERLLLERVSVHRGGFTAASAQRVAGFGEVPVAEVPDMLARLADRSMLQIRTGRAGGPRFHMLATVAEYHRELLADSGAEKTARRAHLEYYAALAGALDGELRGPDAFPAARTLDGEAGNLAEAARHARDTGDAVAALGLAVDTAWYRVLRGRLTEAAEELGAALAVAGGAPEGARATATAWHTGVLTRMNAADEAAHRAAVAGCDAIEDPVTAARARWFLDHVRLGLPGEAAGVCDADAWTAAASRATRAYRLAANGDTVSAREAAEASLAGFTDLGDEWGRLYATGCLAELAERRGDPAEARRLYEANLAVATRLGLRTELTRTLCRLAALLARDGLAEAAVRHYRRAARLAVEQCDAGVQRIAEIGLATVATDPPGPRAAGWGVVRAMEDLAGGEAAGGRAEAAARLLGTVERLRSRGGMPVDTPELDRLRGPLRRALGPERFDAEVAAGHRMGVEEHLDRLTGATAGGRRGTPVPGLAASHPACD